MNLVLVYYTRFLFFCTCKFPKLFTYRFRNHFFYYSMELRARKKSTAVYQRAGLLEGSGEWRSVDIIVPITPDELMSLRKWFHNKEYGYRGEGPESATPHTETAIHPVKEHSYIPFNDTHPDDPSRVSLKTDAFRTCTITTVELPNSVTYLALEFSLNASHQKKLFNIDTSHIYDYQAFQTINPFSKNFRIIHSTHYVDKQLAQGVNRIVGDAHLASKKLFRIWGISTEPRTRITTARLKSAQSGQYIDAGISDYDHYSLISRYPGAQYNHYSAEASNADYVYDFSSVLNLDAFFIDTFVDPDGIKNYLADYLNLSLIKEAWCCYNQCRDSVNPILSRINQNTSETLQTLLEAHIQIERIEEKIEALIAFTKQHYCQVFCAEAEAGLQTLIEKVELLKKRVAQRKSLSNDQVQFENLKFNRFYSWIVGGLALLQVVLAAIVIDWSQALQSNNPVLNNLKALLRWLQG